MSQSVAVMWKRRVVLVILTWALLDLSVPGLCPGEQELPLASTGVQAMPPAVSAVHVQAGGPGSDQTLLDDDCWCCSSHVVPAPHFEVTVLAQVDREEIIPLESSSQGWPLTLYHPPRS